MAEASYRDAEYWVKIARYDLKTAEAMLKTGRYMYVLFMCQQTLEKLLKGLYVIRKKQFPPRIHNLLRLGELTNLKWDETIGPVIEELNRYYLESRYPYEVSQLGRQVDRRKALEMLNQTRRLWRWIRREFPQRPIDR